MYCCHPLYLYLNINCFYLYLNEQFLPLAKSLKNLFLIILLNSLILNNVYCYASISLLILNNLHHHYYFYDNFHFINIQFSNLIFAYKLYKFNHPLICYDIFYLVFKFFYLNYYRCSQFAP
jgi:hypothetical protein